MNLIEKYFGVLATFLLPALYLIVAVFFYLLLYVWKNDSYKGNKIQPGHADTIQIKSEISYGIISLSIFCVTGFLVFVLQRLGYSLIYFQPLKYGVIYLVISVVLMMLFHDMYFYWTHRLLHLNGWYQKVHSVHHLSSNPSPFTSLSFHPVEGLIQAMALPLMIVIIPAHPFALFCFLCFMVYKNVRGHAGYEFTTPAHRKTRWNSFHNYSVQHNEHHLYGRGNYGLYFTFWDRIMNTFRKEE